MSDFWFYTKLGFFHVLDPGGYDHVLFLTALALPFSFLQWKKVFWLATLFTLTHCLSLALAAYGIVEINSDLVETLIPITILALALLAAAGAPALRPSAASRCCARSGSWPCS